MGKDTLEQLPCFDKVYGAVHESIKHWKRICAYIKAELYDDDSDKDDFDYILVATIDTQLAERIKMRIADYGVNAQKILTINKEKESSLLINKYLL